MVTARTTRNKGQPAAAPSKRRRWPRINATSVRARLIMVLRLLGLARRAVPAPVVGHKAYVQWWQRLLAAASLAALSAGIGLALAAAVGLMAVVAGFLLEQAIA